MSAHNIEVQGGSTVRLPTAGKYCDRDIVVTATGGASGENKLAKVVDGSVTEITASDLEGVGTIRQYAFYRCTKLKKVVFPTTTWNTGTSAFYGCTLLETIDFSRCETIRYIGPNSFEGCTALQTVEIPKTVTDVSMYGFSGCTKLSSVVFDDDSTLTTIGSYAFRNCSALESVTIPQSVKKLETGAFDKCTALKTIRIKSKTPPNIQYNTFSNIPTDCVFVVDEGCGDAYKAATNWSAYADKIVEDGA